MEVGILIKEENLRIQIMETELEWFGVTYREDKPGVIARVSGYVKEWLYPENLWG